MMATTRKVTPRSESNHDAGAVQRAIRGTITGGEVISVGVLNLVRNTLVTAVSGARDVGSELGLTAVATVRGTIRAAYSIGGDLGMVAESAARGAVRAAAEVGGDVGAVARKAIEGTIQAAQDIGADVGAAARKAGQGAIEAADRIGAAAGRAVRQTVRAAVQSAKRVNRAPRSVKPAPRARRASLRRRPGRGRLKKSGPAGAE
jgi:hypothetical protein